MIAIPPLPPGDEGVGVVDRGLRYEDVMQDGRVVLAALLQGIGGSAWAAMARQVPAVMDARAGGVRPILRRLVVVGDDGPTSVNERATFEGTWRLAREDGGDRLFCNMWMEARAPRATTHGPRPADGAERVVIGRVFAEHVFTKPFAPPAERKVTRLEVPGLPAIPSLVHPMLEADALVSRSRAALEDAGTIAFGMMHTDSNHHVNSLVYPRLFEEAVVQRVAARGQDLVRFGSARAIELRWRKPFFAGERARIRLAVEGDTARGVFLPADGERPSAAVAMRFA